MSRLVLVNGGARSGKSRLALRLALERGSRRCFVATAEAFDAEMHARIERHRRERGSHFETVEAGLDLPEQLAQLGTFDAVVVDCLTLFLSRVLLAVELEPRAAQERQCAAAVDALLEQARRLDGWLFVVTNEVGMGIVPESALGRVFRDAAGRANQRFAAAAQEIYLATMGLAIQLKPTPIAVSSIDSAPASTPSLSWSDT